MQAFDREKCYKDKIDYLVKKIVKNANSIEKINAINEDNLYDIVSKYTSLTITDNLEKNAIESNAFQEYLYRKFLMGNSTFFDNIKVSERTQDKFLKDRKHKEVKDEYDEEEQCIKLFNEGIKVGGITLYDCQVPLKLYRNSDTKGKVDLAGMEDNDLVIIEYKKPLNREPLLRAVLEILTYYHNMGANNTSDNAYIESFNSEFGTHVDKIRCAIVVPTIRYKIAHRYAYELIERFGIACYTFIGDDFRKMVKISDEDLASYKAQARQYTSILEDDDMADLLVSSIDNILK